IFVEEQFVMSKRLKQNERGAIRNALIEAGELLFGKYGGQQTSITDITKTVGIAEGALHNFFTSNELVYIAILELQENKLTRHALEINFSKETSPKEIRKQPLQKLIKAIETNALIRELFQDNNMKKLVRKLPASSIQTHHAHDTAFIEAIIEKWGKEGITFIEKPEIIVAMLRSLFILTLHQSEIGANIYRETIEQFIHLIVEGMIKEE